jgi:hypothetical protein
MQEHVCQLTLIGFTQTLHGNVVVCDASLEQHVEQFLAYLHCRHRRTLQFVKVSSADTTATPSLGHQLGGLNHFRQMRNV